MYWFKELQVQLVGRLFELKAAAPRQFSQKGGWLERMEFSC